MEYKITTRYHKPSVSLSEFQKKVHTNAVEKGFWNSGNIPEKIACIHEEVSEVLRAYKRRQDHQIPEELADIILRTLDLAEHLGVNISKELLKKYSKNLKRQYLHGKRC